MRSNNYLKHALTRTVQGTGWGEGITMTEGKLYMYIPNKIGRKLEGFGISQPTNPLQSGFGQ